MDDTITDSDSTIGDVFSSDGFSTTDTMSSVDTLDLDSLAEGRDTEDSRLIQRNGRVYYERELDRYPWPMDLDARGRQQDMYNIALAHFDGYLFHAPIIEEPQKVLDIGTGIGAWAIDFADVFRGSTVFGIDWVYLQADLGTPNVHFIIEDVENYPGWYSEFRNVDYVHVGQIGHRVQNLRNILNGISRCCKPGAWVEFGDWVVELEDPNGPVHQWYVELQLALSRYGYDLEFPILYSSTMEEKGFGGITISDNRIPMSLNDTTHTMTSKALLECWAYTLEDLSMEPMTEKLGHSAEYVHELCSSAQRAILTGGKNGYLNWRVIYGQVNHV
ncbi:S-adenosyl-L-methionine-dependent methyltransferase [Aspergillus pseudotamarii]|uniref:S-adenosyl-L-methionine-dependent methyltransferase n=1 Tax=Aspergillus pseudotamarii TaxID=132259 RepID=A0A5N6SFH1_ASPPS|nr:S-adenosyl-L-methionine-dependent methyltransferase [Aspergillus pseudotamarii]KAE8132431.1 S-adenosyl-L-methionine-dependent methyltransferase [Aspergillus pseudotamarii]